MDMPAPPVSQQSPTISTRTKFKIKLFAAIFIVVVLIISSVVVFVFFNKNNNNTQKAIPTNQSPAPVAKPLPPMAGTYKLVRNPISGYLEYYYKGQVQKVTEQKNAILSISFLPESSRSSEQSVIIPLPKYPPKLYSKQLGNNFLEMFEKGINKVDFVIHYDSLNRFTGWELLQGVKR